MKSNTNLTYRMLPVLGILFVLAGLFYLTFKIINAREELTNLEKSLNKLEIKKAQKIQEINVLEQEIKALNNIVEQTGDKNAIDKQVELKEKSKNEIQQINQRVINDHKILNLDTQNRPKISADNYQLALNWEAKAYDYLFLKDIQKAIDAFHNSENAYKAFHNVHEIAVYLEKNKTALQDHDSKFWKQAYYQIANEYNWKMTPEIKARLLREAKR
ncbi:MAG TPA: hypothetical protein PKW80_15515 [Bacteroidales bacterium]|nr:hypothetical protein [Bacteroidales bacterium]